MFIFVFFAFYFLFFFREGVCGGHTQPEHYMRAVPTFSLLFFCFCWLFLLSLICCCCFSGWLHKIAGKPWRENLEGMPWGKTLKESLGGQPTHFIFFLLKSIRIWRWCDKRACAAQCGFDPSGCVRSWPFGVVVRVGWLVTSRYCTRMQGRYRRVIVFHAMLSFWDRWTTWSTSMDL